MSINSVILPSWFQPSWQSYSGRALHAISKSSLGDPKGQHMAVRIAMYLPRIMIVLATSLICATADSAWWIGKSICYLLLTIPYSLMQGKFIEKMQDHGGIIEHFKDLVSVIALPIAALALTVFIKIPSSSRLGHGYTRHEDISLLLSSIILSGDSHVANRLMESEPAGIDFKVALKASIDSGNLQLFELFVNKLPSLRLEDEEENSDVRITWPNLFYYSNFTRKDMKQALQIMFDSEKFDFVTPFMQKNVPFHLEMGGVRDINISLFHQFFIYKNSYVRKDILTFLREGDLVREEFDLLRNDLREYIRFIKRIGELDVIGTDLRVNPTLREEFHLLEYPVQNKFIDLFLLEYFDDFFNLKNPYPFDDWAYNDILNRLNEFVKFDIECLKKEHEQEVLITKELLVHLPKDPSSLVLDILGHRVPSTLQLVPDPV